MDATVVRCLHVVLHVAYVKSFILQKVIVTDDFMYLFTLVPYAEIEFFEAVIHPGVGGLNGEVFGFDGAEDKATELFGFAEVKKVIGVGQRTHFATHLTEATVEPVFEFLEWDIGSEALVETGKRELKLITEFIQGERRDVGLLKNMVGRLTDSRQIIYQRARPIKDDVPNHAQGA